MMTRYAVGWMSAFENDLQVHIVEADTIREATIKLIHKVTKPENMDGVKEWVEDLPAEEEEIKQYFFDCDQHIGFSVQIYLRRLNDHTTTSYCL